MERRLTTILAADIVGYSRLMGGDESGTLEALKAHRAELIDPKATQYGGRTIKLMGDGILMEFASVVDAVSFAVDVQTAMLARNDGIPEDRQVRYRVGINIGDVIVEDDDIYGDGVNVAARLEGLADAGGVCIGRNVRDQIRDKLDLNLEDLGEVEVKNIARPVRTFRVVMDEKTSALSTPVVQVEVQPKRTSRAGLLAILGLAVLTVGGAALWWQSWSSGSAPARVHSMALPLPDKPSIAVLPFNNLSQDASQEYFADGMTEDLITDLSNISGLFVIAHNSSLSYKGPQVKIRQVAEDLGVRYVLEGSVRRVGDKVRINAQLIDSTTGGHLWAERFDRQLEDVFSLQDEVVGRIVEALSVTLTSGERTNLTTAAKVNPKAYDLFLQANAKFAFLDAEANADALSLFRQAVALDPGFARAHAGVAVTTAMAINFGWTKSPQADAEQALRHAHAAAALDSSIPEVHFAKGAIFNSQRRSAEAIEELRRAVAIDPNYADGFAVLGQYLNFAGRPAEGMKAIKNAMRLSPLHGFVYLHIKATGHFVMKQYDEAIALLKNVLERNPGFSASRLLLISIYGHLGQQEDVNWEADELLAAKPGFSIAEERRQSRFERPEELERYIDGLVKAGLPE